MRYKAHVKRFRSLPVPFFYRELRSGDNQGRGNIYLPLPQRCVLSRISQRRAGSTRSKTVQVRPRAERFLRYFGS